LLNKLKPKSEFSRNVLTLMTGTTIAQAIPIAISPILTRIYSPEDFGVFALYIAIVNFIAIIATARYELAIVLPKKDEDAINILALSLIIVATIVAVLFLAILFFKEELLLLLNAKKIGNLLYLVPISILVAGFYQAFNYWSNRKEYFSSISKAQISQSLAIGTTQPIFGYFSIYGGLIVGNLIGRVISLFVLLNKFIKNDTKRLKDIEKTVMLEQLKKYKDFPLINSLHAFSDIIKTSGSVMLISSFFGSVVLGFYALSLRVLQVPSMIIGSALGQVLYQKFTNMHNSGINLYEYVKKVTIILLIVAMPIFWVLYFITPELFAFVFGQKWRVAGEYSQILIPYLFMNFLISPLSSLPIVLNKQKEVFKISLFGNILFVLNIILFHNYSVTFMLSMLSFTMTIYSAYVVYWFFRIVK